MTATFAAGHVASTTAHAASSPARRGPLRWWSLRAQLTAVSTTVITVCVLAAAALLMWRVHASLLGGLDATLTHQAQDVAAQAHNGQVTAISVTGADSATTVQIVDQAGTVVASSANLNGEPPQFRLAATSRVQIHQVSGDLSSDPGTYRVATLSTETTSRPVTVYVAHTTASITASTQSLAAALAIGAPLLIIALSTVAWLLVGRALRPVESLRSAVQHAPGNQLAWRLPYDGAHAELRRLASTFNDLLTRIDASAEQQRRFLADAAHELRSPVAALQARLDVHARQGDGMLPRGETRALADEASRLSTLIESLLGLARIDAATPLRRDLLDLDDLVLDQVHRVTSSAGGPKIDASQVSAAQVRGDRSALDRLIANLLDNAVRHARQRVTVELSGDRHRVLLAVADDGPGVPPGARERIFERFTRLDDARDRDHGGTGLGLAIVSEVATAHGGSVHIADNEPGARFEVSLPFADGSLAPEPPPPLSGESCC